MLKEMRIIFNKFKKILNMLEKDKKYIKLDNTKRTIFIGDTHGDFETTKEIIKNYPPDYNRLIFLGDYVDRGNESKENIDYLLELKLNYKDRIYLLMGNHEAYITLGCNPSNFWDSLDIEEVKRYSELFSVFPFAISINGVIALHGALPDVENLNRINDIRFSYFDERFISILCGDYAESDKNDSDKRPQFNENSFNELINRFNKKILIRSHDPTVNPVIFNNRCLTILTSGCYGGRKRIAILEPNTSVEILEDIKIIEIK